jgi:hypothetical protein
MTMMVIQVNEAEKIESSSLFTKSVVGRRESNEVQL